MRRTTLAAVAVAFMLVPTIVNANEFTIRGAGVASCGNFIQQRNNRTAHLHWIMGYVTGVNVFRTSFLGEGASVDVLNGVDIDAIELWITNYCTENPLETVSDATLALVVEGMKQQK